MTITCMCVVTVVISLVRDWSLYVWQAEEPHGSVAMRAKYRSIFTAFAGNGDVSM